MAPRRRLRRTAPRRISNVPGSECLPTIIPEALGAGWIGVVPTHAGRRRSAGPGGCCRCRHHADCCSGRNGTAPRPSIPTGPRPSAAASHDRPASNGNVAAWPDDGGASVICSAAWPDGSATTMNHCAAARSSCGAAAVNGCAHVDDVGRSCGLITYGRRAEWGRGRRSACNRCRYRDRENGSRQLQTISHRLYLLDDPG